jgi:hypothetical protein
VKRDKGRKVAEKLVEAGRRGEQRALSPKGFFPEWLQT